MLLILLGFLLGSPALFYRRRGTGGYVPPPAVTSRFWVGGTGTWDQATTTHWSASTGGAGGASVPTQYNDVIFDANSGAGTVTLSANAPCNSVTTTGSTITTFVHNASVTLSIGSNSAAGPSSKALDFTGFTTYTKGGGASSIVAFVSQVGTQQTINYGALTQSGQTFNGAGGSWKLLSALSTGIGPWTLLQGSLEMNGFNVTCQNFASSAAAGAGTRALTNSGTSTITITGGGGGQFDVTGSGTQVASGLTVSLANTTITMTGAGAGFRGGGLTYGTLQLTGTGTSVITGANTFTAFTRSNAAAFGTTFPSGATQTIATAAGLTISGASGQLHTITASTAGTAATISIASGTVNANFLSLKDSTATGGATFHAGAGSTNVSGNSGWIFP